MNRNDLHQDIASEFGYVSAELLESKCFDDQQHLIKWVDKIKESFENDKEIKYDYYEDELIETMGEQLGFNGKLANELFQAFTEALDTLDSTIMELRKVVNV